MSRARRSGRPNARGRVRRVRTGARRTRASAGGPVPPADASAPRMEERRRHADRRREPRDTRDRRATGPATAVKLAKVRVSRDVDWLWQNVRQGNWDEVARVASGLGGELASIFGSLAMLPLGLVGRDLPAGATTLDAPEPRASGDERPIVLVHGWFHNRTGFLFMKRRLEALGRRHVYAVDLPTARMGVQRLAAVLGEKIERVRALTGAEQVDIVAHSLGGLVARWWMHHGGGAKRVKHLVTLGAPHKGTALAAFVPIGSGRAINPGSWTVAALAVPPPPGVKVTVIWSDMDYLILPLEDSGWHTEEGNVRLKYVGHLSLLYSRAVFREVWRALGEPGAAP